MATSVGVSAKKVANVAKGQVGYHEGPGNRNKYGPAAPWCVIFLHWVFKHAGGRDPLGNSNVVGPAVAPLPKVGSRKIGDVVTKPGGGVGRGHIGICVGNGKYVAGNSGDAVRYEGGWSEAFRPRYTPDILPIKYNGKTYYYNPETKKLCTDKNGKSPIKGNVGGSGRSSGGGSSGRGGSGSSGGGSTSTYVPYLENYKVKPKNFEDVKDIIITGEVEDQEPSLRVLMVQLDYSRLQEIHPNISIPTSLNNKVDLSVSSLINYYNSMINQMIQDLTVFNKIEDQPCMYIMGIEDDRYGHCFFIESYKEINDNDYNYYQPLSDEWIELYNDLILRRDALMIYQEAGQTNNYYFSTNKYLTTVYKDYVDNYNNQISYYHNAMQQYIEENSQTLDYASQIIELDKTIYSLTSDINKLRTQLISIYNQLPEVEKKKKEKTNLLNNIIDFKDFFKEKYFSDVYSFWNTNIIQSPKSLNFWLDFLDNNSEISKYSVKNLGFQQCVENNQNITSLYNKRIPQIIFYTDTEILDKLKTGYTHLYYPKEQFDNLFVNSAQGISAKNYADELIYLHTYFNEEISISMVPIYYLEPNTRILLYNENTKINNEYILNKITIQLQHNSTMNINASIVPKRLY